MHGSRLMSRPASSTGFVYLGQTGRAAGPFDSERTSRSARHGFTIIEMIVATVLLSAVMVTALPLFGWIIQQRRSADQRQFAVQEVANLAERITANDWESVTSASLAKMTVSERVSDVLSDPRLQLQVADVTGPPTAKRVTIEFSWRDRAGNFVSPVRLVVWIHKQQEPE